MQALIIILVIIAITIIYFFLKPYFVKYDTTIAFTGGLGSGKTLNAVKTGKTLFKKIESQIKFQNYFKKLINKYIIIPHNKRCKKYNIKHSEDKNPKFKTHWKEKELAPLPKFFSNIPILLKKGNKKHEPVFTNKITKDMLLLKDTNIPEYSIVLLDELPQLINQYNWNEIEVQNNVNEFITFFRHYIGGYFIITAQSIDDVVSQIRRKMNTYYWLFDFHKFLFFFYKVRILQLQSSDIVSNVNQGFVEDNMKWIYGTLFSRDYDSRCYSERYNRLSQKEQEKENYKYIRFGQMKTNSIIRFNRGESPLDKKK